ncbi:hypothetical protein [Bacillus weihaiensis]|uniref:Uncharacterized protein n=1 Tax=Bacillus weihaiensis TaxID=1547283 RepID=A0A1L3MWF8_9BACI|nr:hypothetical protein [Bacillus weihaiensis]APH06620.1 hypothetical protein A9C19_19020 [Bacillus weihaiensis]
MELDLFKQWLESNRGLKERSARDVVSRVRRVDKIIDSDLKESYETIVESLDNNEEFNKFSTYVKPQIKRAIKLYKEFIDEKNNINK